ncbi:MAG: DGQHR domain-containing protein [Chloroflexota bacterium]|nr:DGQHR domain-containing protein [Chloroflexota bacterium]
MHGTIILDCQVGNSAARRVLLGFAPASLLHRLSFADVLNEDTGRGYQRRFNAKHSQDFRRYIQGPTAATLPLTFNLRPDSDRRWQLVEEGTGWAQLVINEDAGKIMTQVDCQHRLGYLGDLDILLPFMCFLGLDVADEMEVFNIINSKAKGLSTSLLDFHDAQLSQDLAKERPEIFIALYLNSEVTSPWHRQLDLGGTTTSGLQRRASLRTMQKAIKRFLTATGILDSHPTEYAAAMVLGFWQAVAETLPEQWARPRKHVLNKGVGVYALMDIAADIYGEIQDRPTAAPHPFVNPLLDFADQVDWSNEGPFKGLGGEGGVRIAVDHLRGVREAVRLKAG